MKRNIKKQFWFNAEEAKDLKTKAEKAFITEAALVRMLLKGYEPKEKPDDRFYAAMRELCYRQQHQSACCKSKCSLFC